MQLKTEVLPAPFGPITAVIDPGSAVKDTPRNALIKQKESVTTREHGKHGDHEHSALAGKHSYHHWTASGCVAAYALGKTGSGPHEGAVGDLARRRLAEVEQRATFAHACRPSSRCIGEKLALAC